MVDRMMSANGLAARPALAVVAGGLSAGVLDIVYAITSAAADGHGPEVVLQAVASGLLGRDAFSGGVPVAAVGLALHLGTTLAMAAVFAGAVRAGLTSLRQYPLLSGPLYGVGIYFVMQQVVLPLSRVPLPDPRPPINFADLSAHIFLVGLPIALAAYWWAGERDQPVQPAEIRSILHELDRPAGADPTPGE